jgi:tRNA threonylcarbamoyladenosine biosynthesis protein TsaB
VVSNFSPGALMTILAFDTSTWACVVALVRDGVVLAERAERTRSSHAGTLPTLVEAVFVDAGERLESGDAVAVSIGPGSFTGLRIGLSFAKGLAFARGIRLVGVPTLDALALAAPKWEGRLCAVLDARKQEVYAALYEHDGRGIVRCGAPIAIGAAALAAKLAGRPCTFIGDAVGAYADVFRRVLGEDARLLSDGQHPPRGAAVARLAAARLARDPTGDDAVTLAPFYLRPAEAELTQSVLTPSAPALGGAFVDKVPLVY